MEDRAAVSEKLSGSASGASGLLSFLGGYNVCHNACLLLIAGLSVVGISVQGMPLEFLQDYAVGLWFLALGLLGVTAYMYHSRKCVSKNMLAANSGLIIAAVPFKEIEFLQLGFWIVGFGIVGVAVYSYIKEKRIQSTQKKREEEKWCHTQTQ
ncbi:MAG: hypothetical protein J4224_03595 [Candidatus Diapherotrites archaeon]|uniref:Uncharacterized protein n=1 Tax=Candidatus Iainarchaeum sp. TaxID=3101447 RepID=A0A7J4IUJ6_9ARCH|nr:MAG: hypothetical protein QT03_C0001G0133 [archaeon GW2011_AR10]MBS3059476.1 hypothetical protein [Candidatus Diapherotrites archaeon]HIH08464.1 hypothetical protein [Candidatus Diapherotrites archaeon]